jgi:hypothetical protein
VEKNSNSKKIKKTDKKKKLNSDRKEFLLKKLSGKEKNEKERSLTQISELNHRMFEEYMSFDKISEFLAQKFYITLWNFYICDLIEEDDFFNQEKFEEYTPE